MPGVQGKHWSDAIVEELPRLVIVDEAAKVFRKDPKSVRLMIKLGQLKALKTADCRGGRLLIPRDEIGRYLRGLEEAGAA